MSQSQVVYDSLKDGNLATSACLNNNQKVIWHLGGGDNNKLLWPLLYKKYTNYFPWITGILCSNNVTPAIINLYNYK